MLLTLVCLVSAAAALPVSVLYDRRQDGDLNISADVQNIVFLVAIPNKLSLPIDLIDLMKYRKGQTRHSEAQDRADHVLEAFVEPDTPYQVEIGSDRSAGGGGRAVEVVIAGKRRMEAETEPQDGSDEIKLIGAREQCGPDRERDPDTLMCRFKKLDLEDIKPISSPNSLQSEPQKMSTLQKEPVKSSTSSPVVDEKPLATPEVIPS